MKYSLKRHFGIIFISLITGTILMCLLLNTTLLEKYYINNKINALISAYNSINEASNAGDITTEDYDIELQKICGKYNINVLVADSDSEMIKTSMPDSEFVIKHLLHNIIIGVDPEAVLREGDNYKMQIVTDGRTKTEYIEMWGVLDNSSLYIEKRTGGNQRECFHIESFSDLCGCAGDRSECTVDFMVV